MHAGILADRRLDSHVEQLADLDVEPFDLVVSNLYPFTATVASGASPDECVEQIDIGGPSMVRAAAKNHPSVAIVTSPDGYPDVLAAVADGGFTLAARKSLAAEAFVHTASYDVAVASWMGNVVDATPPTAPASRPGWAGRGPSGHAALRREPAPAGRALRQRPRPRAGLAQATQLHGKEMSYNNYLDSDAARRAAYDFDEPAVAIIKHANPCGIAVGADVADAHAQGPRLRPGVGVRRRDRGQPAGHRRDGPAGRGDLHRGVVAPAYEDGALEVLAAQEEPADAASRSPRRRGGVEFRPISGGLLLQAADRVDAARRRPVDWTLATGEAADAGDPRGPRVRVAGLRAVKSNAILLAKDGATVGVGMGQVNRVDSCQLAVARAGADRAHGSRPRPTRSSRSPTACRC